MVLMNSIYDKKNSHVWDVYDFNEIRLVIHFPTLGWVRNSKYTILLAKFGTSIEFFKYD